MNGVESTEVKCSEESKGGMKFELVLQKPTVDSPKNVVQTPPPKNVSIEDIEKKLRAAEERRQSLEVQKLNLVAEKLSHVVEIREKREEYNNNFMQSAKENLEQKFEVMKENRETHIKVIKDKARESLQKFDEKRKQVESPVREEKLVDINRKLMTAQEKRDFYYNNVQEKIQEKIKEHDKHILDLKKQLEEQIVDLREKSLKKQEIAQAKRESLQKEIQEKQREHERHIEEVRKKAMSGKVGFFENGKENFSG